MKSNIPGFHALSAEGRIEKIRKACNLDDKDIEVLKGGMDNKISEMMSENVIGTIKLPVGIATNFVVDGKEYLIPMCIEEPSVVAAASHAAKLARAAGGFKTHCDPPVMIGQIQIMGVKNTRDARKKILSNIPEIKKIANHRDSVMIRLGGGMCGVEAIIADSSRGKILIVHLLVNVMDAMGANCVNSMCEGVSPYLEKLTGGRSVLKIVSNLSDRRLVRSSAVWKRDVIGKDIIEGILDAYEFARVDVYRCATNNKGIMNGVDAVAIATGNDFRALEAGAHSFAARNGYRPLATYKKNKDGDIVGTIEMPMPVGIVGGATKTNPVAKTSLKILGISSARELAGIMASVGLANNFAAMRAMVSEGIQHGHMKLHAKNIAMSAGAMENMVADVARRMIELDDISVSSAQKILGKMPRPKKNIYSETSK